MNIITRMKIDQSSVIAVARVYITHFRHVQVLCVYKHSIVMPF